MTNKEILKKAIEKAVKGGWHNLQARGFQLVMKEFEGKPKNQECYILALIFSHDFAKAFWGKYPKHETGMDGLWTIYHWEDGLQQMVLEKEPLKYLRRFL